VNSNITIAVITLCFIFLPFSLANPTRQVNAQSDVFSMIGIKSSTILSSGLEDNIITCSSLVCSGTSEADTIIGSSLSEEISSLDGDDAVQGNNGEDIIYGGDGSDSIQGGGGLDNIFGQDGNDYIYADSSISLPGALVGDQSAIIKSLNDKLLGAADENFATDTDLSIKGPSATDIFISLSSNNLIYSESYLDGGEGNDYLFGGSDNDVFVGGPGNDFFDCNEGLDHILDFDPNEDTANVDCEMLD